MVYAIRGINGWRYVDKIIKLIENVPELLTITGFLKSSLIEFGYKITLKTIKIKNTAPMPAHRYLRYG